MPPRMGDMVVIDWLPFPALTSSPHRSVGDSECIMTMRADSG
jgi:hypothetical protein